MQLYKERFNITKKDFHYFKYYIYLLSKPSMFSGSNDRNFLKPTNGDSIFPRWVIFYNPQRWFTGASLE